MGKTLLHRLFGLGKIPKRMLPDLEQEGICSLEDETTLCVRFDPSAFHESWSGAMECRFSTPRARSFLEHLKEYSAF